MTEPKDRLTPRREQTLRRFQDSHVMEYLAVIDILRAKIIEKDEAIAQIGKNYEQLHHDFTMICERLTQLQADNGKLRDENEKLRRRIEKMMELGRSDD